MTTLSNSNSYEMNYKKESRKPEPVSKSWLSKAKRLSNLVLGTAETTVTTTVASLKSEEDLIQWNQNSSNNSITTDDSSIDQNDTKNTTDEQPIQIRITGGRLCTSILRCELICHQNQSEQSFNSDGKIKSDSDLLRKGKFKWYRINCSAGEMSRIEGAEDTVYHPHLDDIGMKITCQYVPFAHIKQIDSQPVLYNCPSMFAQIGPILMDPELDERCNEKKEQLLKNRIHPQFRINMRYISSHPQILTITKQVIKVAPAMTTAALFSKHSASGQMQSFDIQLTSETRILFSDNYCQQFAITDDEGNEYAQIITKDHNHRQFIGLLIRKILNNHQPQLQPKNKQYLQHKIQQLTERNNRLQKDIACVTNQYESILPIIETLAIQSSSGKENVNYTTNKIRNDNLSSLTKQENEREEIEQNLKKFKILKSTQRESKLYMHLKDNRKMIHIFKLQLSDITAERELLKQNCSKVTGHLKKALKNITCYKDIKKRIKQKLDIVQKENDIINEEVQELRSENRDLKDKNICITEKMKIAEQQKNDVINILKTDVNECAGNKRHAQLMEYCKSDLINILIELQDDIYMEKNIVQKQVIMIEKYVKEVEKLRVRNMQLKDRLHDKKYIFDDNIDNDAINHHLMREDGIGTNAMAYNESIQVQHNFKINKHENAQYVIHDSYYDESEDEQTHTHKNMLSSVRVLNTPSNNLMSDSKNKYKAHESTINSMDNNTSKSFIMTMIRNTSKRNSNKQQTRILSDDNSFVQPYDTTSSYSSIKEITRRIPPAFAVKHLDIDSERNTHEIQRMKVTSRNAETWTTSDVVKWSNSHPSNNIKKLSNQFKYHGINGVKLKELDEVSLHMFGISSNQISKTKNIIEQLFKNVVF